MLKYYFVINLFLHGFCILCIFLCLIRLKSTGYWKAAHPHTGNKSSRKHEIWFWTYCFTYTREVTGENKGVRWFVHFNQWRLGSHWISQSLSGYYNVDALSCTFSVAIMHCLSYLTGDPIQSLITSCWVMWLLYWSLHPLPSLRTNLVHNIVLCVVYPVFLQTCSWMYSVLGYWLIA